jgi:hypothetical protein
VPLFTEADLARAFTFLLPAADAQRVAREWFSSHVESTEPGAYFMYEHWELSGDEPQNVAIGPPRDTSIEAIARREADFWNDLSQSERVEWICPRFSGIHFDFVAQLSDEHFERMRSALHDSPEAAERRRRIVQRVVELIRVP